MADAMLLGKKRLAQMDVDDGCAVEAEFSRKDRTTLKVRIVSPDAADGDGGALGRAVRDGMERIGRVIEGFESIQVVVENK
jgi:hypothetical protein